MSKISHAKGTQDEYTLEGFPAAAIRFVRALERNRELIAQDHGVSASELDALFHIAEVASTTPKELAHHMKMTTGAITAIASRLVAAELIHRVDHPSDRRSLFLQLTSQGHDLMAKIHSEFRDMIAESTTGLTAQQLAEFEVSLETVSKQIAERTKR
jgi:DNA-binding MarR family transcriptional regulator